MKLASRRKFEKEMQKDYTQFENGETNGYNFKLKLETHHKRYGETPLNQRLTSDYETELRRRSC